MKCFHHHDADAVGVCKSCGKGLCVPCAVDIGRGLACRERCEEDVRNLIHLVDNNMRLSPASQAMLGKQPRAYLASGTFQILAGCLFMLLGFNMDGIFRAGVVGIGALVAVLGAWQIVYGLGIRKVAGQVK
jgi:hypothetical protein